MSSPSTPHEQSSPRSAAVGGETSGLFAGSPDLFRVLLDSMTEGVSLATEDGVIVYTNPAEDRLFGYGPGELVGRHVSVQNAYPPEQNERVVAEVIAALKADGVWRGDWLNRRKDGTTFVTTSKISKVEVDGRPHWLCVQEDVTEERTAAGALARSEARLQLATEAAGIGVWEWDLLTGAFDYSAVARRICGFDLEGPVTYEMVVGVTHPEDFPLTRAKTERVLDPDLREQAHYEYRLIVDGEVRWVVADGHAEFREVAGELRAVRFLGTLRDVTDLKSAEIALRESETRALIAEEAAGIGAWSLDLEDSGKNWWSPQMYRITRMRPDWRPDYQEWLACIGADDRDRVHAEISRALSEEGADDWAIEYRYAGHDGIARRHETRGAVRRSPGGAAVGAHGIVLDVTERIDRELALVEGAERLRLATEHAEVGFWDVDEINSVLHWPPLVKAMFGVSADRPVSMADFYAGLHPDDRERTAEAYAAAADPERRALYDVEYRTVGLEDGMIRWVAAKGRGVFDRDGRCVRVVGTAVDVTRRKVAEQALQELNETLERRVVEATAERRLLADVVESSPALIAALSPERRFLALNKAYADLFERTFGVRPKVGDDLLRLLEGSPEARARAAVLWERALGGEEFVETVRAHGGAAYEVRFNLLKDRSGPVIGAFQHAVDVSERVAAERRAAEAEAARRDADALYRAYFHNTPEALFVIGVEQDGGFVVEELNPAHQRDVGLKLEEVRGRRIEDILPEEAAAKVLDSYRRVVETGEIYQYREIFHLGDRPQHWDTALCPVRDDTGRIVRLIGSSREVTRQVVAEEALRQAQKMEAVGQLTGGIAHDFNNLLSAVVGSLDLIRRKPEDVERVRRLAQAGMEAAERGAKLTGQLLAFSRAQRIELKPVSPAEVAEGMHELLTRALGPAIRLSFALDHRGAVLSDVNQLEMAVLNLAINARDAMREGGELTISTALRRLDDSPDLASGDYVEIAVADTGVGMTPEVIARAFDPFFTTKGVGRGTGLGLSQVYGIVRQAGGGARIDSRPGEGTTVRLLLPATDQPVAQASDSLRGAEPVGGPSAKVLVVDDDDHVRRMMVETLQTLGYEVLEAADGRAGVTAAITFAPELMIVDFAMPGMTGAEVVRQVKSQAPALPVIFATGYADTAAIEAAAGDAPVLAKPFTVSALQTAVFEALARADFAS